MLDALSKHWWAFALRGVVAILFGLFALMIPGLSLVYLVAMFAIYALLDGVFNIISAFRTGGFQWTHLLAGALSVAAGLLAFMWPGITAVALLYVIAFWAMFTGALAIAGGVWLRKVMEHEWVLILMGVVSILFGGMILMNPAVGALAVSAYIAVYALFSGVSLITLSLRLRSYYHHHTPGTPMPRPI